MAGSGNDTINTDDTLSGTNENGYVTSTNDDTNDSVVIDGGDGNDTVTFGKDMSDYTITTDAQGNIIVTEGVASDSDGDGIGDVTELRNVETIKFADGTYDTATGNFVSNDTQADDLTASIDVGDATVVMAQVDVVDTVANQEAGIYEKDGSYYQEVDTNQVDTDALRELGYTIDSEGNFYVIDENAPKVLVEQEVQREVTHVVETDPIMKEATETTTFESLGNEFSHTPGTIESGTSTTITLDETTKNIELDFNHFTHGSLQIEFLNDAGEVIATRTTYPTGNDERGYGFGEEFSAVRLTANGSDIEVESIQGRGLPETVTVEAGGLVPDYDAMEAAGISWSETEHQTITQSADITNIGNVGNSKVDGFNPEDHESSQVFDFGPDLANRLVTITVEMEVKGSWDNNTTSTNDYFSVSANGKELDVNYYSSNSNANTYESDDVSYIGWDQAETYTYEYQVYLDDNGQAQLDFMVASTASDEIVNVKNIEVTYEGQSGWVKEETTTETYTESVLVDAPAQQVDASEIEGGVPMVSQEIVVEPMMTTEDVVNGYVYPVDISAALSDTDGSESLTVMITGVPEGATLSEGINNGDGTWTISVPEGATSIEDSLTITVPAGIGEFELSIVATGTELSTGDTNTVIDTDIAYIPNDAPEASDDIATTDEDTSVIIDATNNDTDSDGDELSIVAIDGQDVTNGQVATITDTDGNELGTAIVTSNGEVEFTPSQYFATLEQGENTDVTFSYTVSDGVETDTANITVNVTGVDHEASAPTLDMEIGDASVINTPTDSFDDLAIHTTGGINLEDNTYSWWDNTYRTNDADQNLKVDNINVNDIVLGGGDDTMSVKYSANNVNINAGSGNDSIVIGGSTDNSTINMGDGNDNLQINGNIGSEINLGSGDDKIQISSDNNVNFNSGAVVNGGSGEDTLYLTGSSENYVMVDNDGNSHSMFDVIHNIFNMNGTGDFSNNEVKIYKVDQNGNTQGNPLIVRNIENIVFEADAVDPIQTYSYDIDLSVGLTDTDGSETLSDITLNNIPDGATLTDVNGNEISANLDGTYTITPNENGDATVTLSAPSELDDDSISGITASVTSTEINGGDTSTVVTDEDNSLDAMGDISDDGDFTFDMDDIDIDFNNIDVDSELAHINSIDMTEGSHEISNLDAQDVLNMTGDNNTLTILGDADDRVSLDSDIWTPGETTIDENGNEFNTFTSTAGSGEELQTIQIMIDSNVQVDQS